MSQKQARAARRAAVASNSFQSHLDTAVSRHRAGIPAAKPRPATRRKPSPLAGLTLMVGATVALMGTFLIHDTTPAPQPIGALAVADLLPVPEGEIKANPEASLNFDRPSVQTSHDEDAALAAMMVLSAGRPAPDQEHAKFDSPVKHPVRTSPFGTRVSPITGQLDEFHTGQDFGEACGEDVEAVAGGTVVFAGWHEGGGGNRVEVDHGHGLKTTYNHLESFSVKTGQHLKRGQSLGKVGSTGASTGCHLHFETWLNGKLTDPVPWL
jgi:murein DD-endopeptidase MepM/ murein hydrolase activator NlpD